jgi:hypothetical protein
MPLKCPRCGAPGVLSKDTYHCGSRSTILGGFRQTDQCRESENLRSAGVPGKTKFIGTSFPRAEDIRRESTEFPGCWHHDLVSLQNRLDKWELEITLSDKEARYYLYDNIRSLSGSSGIVVLQNGVLMGRMLLGRA